MNQRQMMLVARGLAEHALSDMRGGVVADVSPEHSLEILSTAFLAVMLETRVQTVEFIAAVVERSDPPPNAECAPRAFAGAIRRIFEDR